MDLVPARLQTPTLQSPILRRCKPRALGLPQDPVPTPTTRPSAAVPRGSRHAACFCLAFDPFMQQIVSYPVRRGSKLDGKSDHQPGHGPCCLPFEPPTFGADDNDFFQRHERWPFTTSGWCSKYKNVTSSARLVGCNNITFSATVDKPENDDGSDSNSNERTQEYPTISSMEEAARLVQVRLGSHPGVNRLRLVE